jgi:hypothetical protein
MTLYASAFVGLVPEALVYLPFNSLRLNELHSQNKLGEALTEGVLCLGKPNHYPSFDKDLSMPVVVITEFSNE